MPVRAIHGVTHGQADRARDTLAALRDALARDPLRYFVGTPPQVEVWKSPSKRRLFRTGNQVGGKTTAGCAEVHWWCTGTHPYRRTPRRPVQVWAVCVSIKQSQAIQKKLWALAPKHLLRDPGRYNSETGWGINNPVITYKNGSQCWIRTWNQDPLEMAGASLDFVWGDEPPKRQRAYAELERRLTRTGGEMLLTMTPVNARIDWIRELAEMPGDNGLTDMHFRATPEMLRLANGTPLYTDAGELMDAAWLEKERRKVLKWEEPVVIDGEWEMRAEGAVWEAWNPDKHVVRDLLNHKDVGPRSAGRVRLCLGIDYGSESLRTAATLCAVQGGDARKGRPTRVWVLDEYVPDHGTTTEMDGDALLQMLARNGLEWSRLARVYGDKSLTDARGRVVRKSNAKLETYIARRLGLSGRTVPRIDHVKRGEGRGRGAVWHSVRWLHERMLTPGGFVVDARCTGLVDAIHTWDGGSRHVAKDRIDALRYALADYWSPSKRGSRVMADRMRLE